MYAQVLAYALVHAGIKPAFFSPTLYQMLVSDLEKYDFSLADLQSDRQEQYRAVTNLKYITVYIKWQLSL